MPKRRDGRWGAVAWFACAVLALACARDPAPAPVAWDREVCAQCRMLISERDFAAQYEGEGGQVFFFDDPGCWLLHRAAHPEHPAGSGWFHAQGAERWIAEDRAAFLPSQSPTPMGYGLYAVEAEPGREPWSMQRALEYVERIESERRESR